MNKEETEEKLRQASDYIKGLIDKLNQGTIDDVETKILEEYLDFVSIIQKNNQ